MQALLICGYVRIRVDWPLALPVFIFCYQFLMTELIICVTTFLWSTNISSSTAVSGTSLESINNLPDTFCKTQHFFIHTNKLLLVSIRLGFEQVDIIRYMMLFIHERILFKVVVNNKNSNIR